MWLNHEKQGGVAAIRINDVIDAGDILEERPVPILAQRSEGGSAITILQPHMS